MIQIGREFGLKPSSDVEAAVRGEGGLNRFGDPMYRVVWSMGRLAWWRNHAEQLVMAPKYWDKPDRWVIEKWCPPGMYHPWNEHEMGPFPVRGDYECSFVVEDAAREFIQVTPAIARELIRRVRFGESLSEWQRLTAIRRREERRERARDRERHDIYSNSPTIYTGSYVPVAKSPAELGLT